MNYLITQATYQDIEVGLFQNSTLKKIITIPKIEACISLATTIYSLLQEFKISYADLSFIGSSQGPAPFTTLRVLISTINGFSFAQNFPLVGVDGLKAFYIATENANVQNTIILLNAFNKDVYFAYKINGQLVTGWENIFRLLEKLKSEISKEKICFLGNGTDLFKQEISSVFEQEALFPSDMLNHAPLTIIAQLAVKNFENKLSVKQLAPLYLKSLNH
jgi:tRNA threonylcarbamoyl adenosine modification protein YeaZ